MSWARGTNSSGRAVGYSVNCACDHPDCAERIDRGLAYICGGIRHLHEEFGCGLFFCAAHARNMGQLCERCVAGAAPFEPKPDERAAPDG